ncbi:MAG: bifunctional folylpolyglutamate synthase/dihydrofolate synthase [Hyphomicrobiaceae bacterium]|nr:bifunctional folylpolyglutamate synthase/dihydrofolate synthase [Hyphomicrobiaceae bacterium]
MPTSDELLAQLKRLHPQLIDLSLGRIERLLAKLGNPHERLPPVIHVAGTNGKGSTSAYLKSMLEAAGCRVHVYTSPHLVRFHERISLAGPAGKAGPIGETALIDLLAHVSRVNGADPITFFEITTAAAFVAFAETPADAVILEVGLGGRLDATNVVARPLLSVITPVAMDHAEKLGDTLGKIAGEKAGILKPDVPAVISQQEDEALQVICNRASCVRAPVRAWGHHFDAYEQRGRLVFQQENVLLDLPKPGLIGRHQIVNAGTAVAAALALRRFGLGEPAIGRGLVEVEWPARMQRLRSGPLPDMTAPGSELWLDGGHNPAGGKAIAQTLADLEERSSSPLHLIVGMMGHKDAEGFLSPFRGLAKGIVTVPIPGAHEAPHQPEALASIARDIGFRSESAADVPAAIRQIEAGDDSPKRILICGSLYLAGHVLAVQQGMVQQSN